MATQQKSRNASFAEVVFEGKPKVVRAFLHGLMLGQGREGEIYFSFVEDIDHGGKAPRFAERFGLPGTDVHVIVDSATNALLKKLAKRIGPEQGLRIVSQRRIRSAKMDLRFEAFAPKYFEEIMDFLGKLPAGLKLRGFTHQVRKDDSAKGIETYSVVHHFESSGEGTVWGPVDALVTFKRACKAFPLIETQEIRISVG
jgi:hypothetical protein